MEKDQKFSTESEPFEKFYQIQIQIWILAENASCNVHDLLDVMSMQLKILLLNFALDLSENTFYRCWALAEIQLLQLH